jgi:branched-chain amino acid transport system permease protein
VGINVTAFKLKAFVISAILAGMAGALFGLNFGSLQASKFSYTTSIDILVYVVLGGMGNILGSIISTVVLYLIPEFLRSLADFRMIMYAVVLIVVMLCTWSPKIKGFISRLTDTVKVAVQKLFSKKEVTGHEG